MTPTKPRVVYYTSGLWPCGVASYQRHVAAALDGTMTVETVALPADRVFGRHLRGLTNRRRLVRSLARRSDGAAGVLVDYTDTFFNGSRPGENMFALFARSLNTKPVVILHELPGRSDPPEVSGPLPLKVVQRSAHRLLAGWDARTVGYESHLRTRPFTGVAHVVTHAAALADPGPLGLPPSRVHLLPTPAYPLPAGASPVPDLDARFGLAGRRVVVMLGFPQPSKGFDRAVAALPHLPADVVLVQLGAADRAKDTAEALDAQAAALGVAGRFVRAGTLEDHELQAILARASAAVAPFRSVHQSSSLGHLVAAGLPVVASRIPGIEPMAAAGAGITFADCDDPVALARTLGEVLTPGPLRDDLIARNRVYTTDHSFQTVADRIAELVLTPVRGRV